MNKRCFKCLCVKPLTDFYKHAAMADKHLNKCKECTKRDVNEHRQANLQAIRAYDNMRASMPHRVEARKAYANTPEGRAAHAKALKASALRYPERQRARQAVTKALMRGQLTRWACEVCGGKAEAHHPHYGAPLLVTWLCTSHHREAHRLTEQIEAERRAA